MRPAPLLASLMALLAACSGEAPSTAPDGGAAQADAAAAALDASAADAGAEPDARPGDAAPDGGAADAGAADSGLADAGEVDAGEIDAGEIDAGTMPGVPDPELTGPYAIDNHAETIRVAASRNDLPLDCYFPTDAGAYPLVLIGHGFRIPASQYTSYAQHLASFGFVACTADFAAGFIANHAENARDVRAGIDALLAADADSSHPLGGRIDETQVGVTGHSLGGKVAFLVAADDSRVGAVMGLDPVDSSMLCNETRCPDASDMLPFSIPVGLIGETLDATGAGQACAPAADNFQTFYSAASSPALEVDVLGASHMSFIDDPSTCGLPCTLCNPASADHADILRLARAMTVAFFARHLRGEAGYDAYLSGPIAQTRYVQTGLAAIQSK